jgi:crossover junction endodeoxyribonuclease RuvC
VTGYGVIDKNGNYLRHVVHGEIKPRKDSLLSEVLADIFRRLGAVIAEAHPQAVALENIFYGKNVLQPDPRASPGRGHFQLCGRPGAAV